MILKFDHIAFTCKRKELDEVLASFSEYKQVFFEKGLLNLSVKKQLLSTWKEDHDIVLLNREISFPVEITAYDDTCEGGKFEINNGAIIVLSDNIFESEIFYQAIGFKKHDDMMEIRTILDKRPIPLKLIPESDNMLGQTYLDSAGYCCLAFVTNNAEKERGRLIGKGVKVTGIQPLRINGKNVNIFFAYNDHSDICEFISIN